MTNQSTTPPTPSSTDYDIVVIGGGSAGYAAARTASSRGAATALVESSEPLGGTCILRGCMPSKALIESANRLRDMREAQAFGIRLDSAPQIDWSAVQDRKRDLISGFQHARRDELHEGPFDLIRGAASFCDPHTLQVCAGKTEFSIRSRAIVVATGSAPFVPTIEGLTDRTYLTSEDLLDIGQLPGQLLILGGGPVGLEFAHCFEGLGSEVTVVQQSPRILNQFAPRVSHSIEQVSAERGIHVLTNAKTRQVSNSGTKVVLEIAHKGSTIQIKGDALLVATGRRPCTSRLRLDRAQVDHAEQGRIRIDARCATSAPHIFAAGDCASPYPVVHLAVLQGEIAGHNAARHLGFCGEDGDRIWNPAHRLVGVFTQPEAAQAGFGAEEARAEGIACHTASHAFAELGKGEIKNCRHGFVELVLRETDGVIIGATAVGPAAVDLIHPAVVAIHQHLDLETFAAIPHYHPTLAEIWSYATENGIR